MKKTTIFIFVITLLATFLRLWQIGSVPPSLDWDEAALGYNAYSIMQTGKDEYGKPFPVVLRSFDDYKPALYAYLIIPFIKIIDLNIVSVRLPSVIFGVATIIAVFFLLRELFPGGSLEFEIGPPKSKWKFGIAEVGTLLLAISPWHIQFSRIAFESNVGLAFNVFSSLLFIKGLKKPWLLVLSAILMALNIYCYQSEKVFTPLLLLGLVLIYKKELFKLPKKYIFSSIVIGLIMIFPMVNYIFTNQNALLRAQGVSVFSDNKALSQSAQKLIDDKNNYDVIGYVFDNRRVDFAKLVVSSYLSHFDLNWLFIAGDIARHHAPFMGLLYLWELPFLFIGIYRLVFGNFDKKTKYLVIFWFLAAPVPAAVTSGVPHAVRTLNFLPMFQIFIAAGLLTAVLAISNLKSQISNIQIKYLIFALCFLFFIFNFLYYLNQYFVQQNFFDSEYWQYGYKQTVEEIKKIENNYPQIIVSNKPSMDQSYIFFLFYLKYPPALYQSQAKNVSGGFAEVHRFGKYYFRPIDWKSEFEPEGKLYVGNPMDFPEDVKEIKIIRYLDGKDAMKIIQKQ